jgi:hypothetical protein
LPSKKGMNTLKAWKFIDVPTTVGDILLKKTIR